MIIDETSLALVLYDRILVCDYELKVNYDIKLLEKEDAMTLQMMKQLKGQKVGVFRTTQEIYLLKFGN